MTGKVDDPKAFCASKIHELTGNWPAEESAPVRAVERVQLTDIEPGEGPYPGAIWNVTLIGPDPQHEKSLVTIGGKEYIRSKNSLLYSVEALRDNVPMFDGCKVYDNHLTDAEFKERGGMRSFGNELTGAIVGVRFDESARKLRGQYRVGDRQYARKLADFYELGILAESAGLSIDTFPVFVDVRHEGKRLQAAVGFERINSTDVVTEPAAGGTLDRRIAANQFQLRQEADDMSLTREQVEKIVAEALAANGSATEQVAPEVTGEEAATAVAEEVLAALEEIPEDADPVDAAQEVADAAQEVADEVAAIVDDETPAEEEPAQEAELVEKVRKLEHTVKLGQCQSALHNALRAAKLDEADTRVIASAFNGRIFKRGELMETIRRAKEAQASRDPSGQVRQVGGGIPILRAGPSPMEQAEIGLVQLMADRGAIRGGMRALEANDNYYVKERWTPALRSWVNSGRGNYRPRNLANWLYQIVDNPYTMSTREANDVGSITKNSVNLFLAADYSVREEWWAPLVTELEVDTIDDSTLVRAYGFEDLDIVLEGGTYTAIDLADEEETASFVKHGNYVGVTLETMLKDKLNVLQSIPKRLADSWYNTQSAKVSAVFTTNTATGPVLSDTGALFNATATTTATGHANLLTTGLGFSSWGAVRTAMRKQTVMKLGAGRRAQMMPRYMLVSDDLETTGLQIRNSEYEPGTGDNDINPYYQQFDVIPVPDWTDADNWAAVADPALFPAIYMIYVRGHRVPQIYEAGDETSGAVFSNDTWRYKVRLMIYRFSSTYDCAPVADFRPLHKSNV